jgi:hypothetical protein
MNAQSGLTHPYPLTPPHTYNHTHTHAHAHARILPHAHIHTCAHTPLLAHKQTRVSKLDTRVVDMRTRVRAQLRGAAQHCCFVTLCCPCSDHDGTYRDGWFPGLLRCGGKRHSLSGRYSHQ